MMDIFIPHENALYKFTFDIDTDWYWVIGYNRAIFADSAIGGCIG